MSENEAQTPEQIREEIESLLGETVSSLGELVRGGGKVTRILRCDHCHLTTKHDIEIADADLLVKALNALSAAAPRLKGKEEAANVKAIKHLDDLSEVSSVDIAERIVLLEEQIAQERS